MRVNKEELLSRLPPEWPEDLMPEIRARVEASGRKVVVLDDDPTGTQTIHDVTVLTGWPQEALVEAFREGEPLLYLLTNSRSLPAAEAEALNHAIAARMAQARQITGRDFVIASRSDSTLRGHFPQEIYALGKGLGARFDGVLVVPFFLEGGRLTIDDIHYVAEGEWLAPAAETEYARDAAFGYHSSNLREWVSEKHGGDPPPGEVRSISIQELRTGGPQAAAARLRELQGGRVCIANAASYRDLEVLVLGLLEAEAAGKLFIYRTAASFVRVRAGQDPRRLLTSGDLAAWLGPGPGLVVAGSYIQKSSRQIEAVRELAGITALEIEVEALLDPARREGEVRRAAAGAGQAFSAGRDVLIYTSRKLVTAAERADGPLQVGQSVSGGLVEIVRAIQTRPAWMIAKGGITASDVATQGLETRRARVLGQVLQGVPVWITGPESRWPGLVYVVFPGNVGGPGSLMEVAGLLRAEKRD